MRRFSALTRCLKDRAAGKSADFAFLQVVPEPPSSATVLSGYRPESSGEASKAFLHKAKQQTTHQIEDAVSLSEAMKRLLDAAERKDLQEAERAFGAVPSLGSRPAALTALIQLYCEMRDFTSAKAVLLVSLDKIDEPGATMFITYSCYSSRSSSDVEDLFNRWSRMTTPSPYFASAVLYTLRFLGDSDAFERVWSQTAQYWEPSLKPATLLARVLESLMSEDWSKAAKLWRIAAGMSSFDVRDSARVFHLACRYFILEMPSVEALNRVLTIMHELGQSVNSDLTALLLRYLPPMHLATRMSSWLKFAKEQDWEMGNGGRVAWALIHNQARRFSFGHELYKYGMRRAREAGLRIQPRSIVDGGTYTPEFDGLMKSSSSASVFSILKSMQNRGLEIPYTYFVVAFQKLSKLESPRIRELPPLLREYGYPLHCAGIDLSVIELQARESGYDLAISRRLLSDYLIQYPLLSHGLQHLTRIGLLLYQAKDFGTAQSVIDSLRMASPSTSFDASNHDSASIQLILQCRASLHEPLSPFLRSALADKPMIYFDKRFLRKVKRFLQYSGEPLDVLGEVNDHNELVKTQAFAELDIIIDSAVDMSR